MAITIYSSLLLFCTFFPAIFITCYGFLKLAPHKLTQENIADQWWAFNKRAGTVFFIAIGIFIAMARFLEMYREDINLEIASCFPGHSSFLFLYSFPILLNTISLVYIFFLTLLQFLSTGYFFRKLKKSNFSLFSYLRFTLALFFSRNMLNIILFIVLVNGVKFINFTKQNVSINWITTITILTAYTVIYFYSFNLINRVFRIRADIEDSELKSKATAMATTANVKFEGIYSITTFDIPMALAYATSDYKVYLSDAVKNMGTPYTDAIIAHEIAHFRHIKKLAIIKFALYLAIITSFCAIFPVIDALTSRANIDPVVFIGELYFIYYLLKVRGKISQRYETEADRTAAELVSNEAVITALEKMHEINLLPRQFDKKKNTTISHPSLEERISNLTPHEPSAVAASDSTENQQPGLAS